jgi:dihydrodipicolinate synthase/N-acetylneuraminate lyase
VSARDRVDWRGYWPASPTPFTATGDLDEAALRRTMELYVGHGVHGVLINGTTGEWWSQTPVERRRVVEVAVSAAAGAVPVVVGVTTYTPGESAKLARAAADAGADGVLSTVPPYVRPTEDEAVAWYRGLAKASPLPVMVYNWPRGVGLDLSLHALRRIAALDNVAAIKESSGDELKTLEVVEALVDEVRVFARFIGRRGLAMIREVGGDGNIDGGGIGAPFAGPYYDAVWAGDLAGARELADRYRQVGALLIDADYAGRFASPVAQVKAVMRLLGQPGGWVRPPLIDPDLARTWEAVGAGLEASGLLDRLAQLGPDPRLGPDWPMS